MSIKETIIAVDAMGGDKAPNNNIYGALDALAANEDLKVILVGQKGVLESKLKRKIHRFPGRLKIEDASEIISMDEAPSQVVRKKKQSSIHVGLSMLKQGKADAFLSAGNSGAVMGVALTVLGRLPAVERPAILVRLPTSEGFSMLLDAGANVDCKVSQLYQFAEMGSFYAQLVEGQKSPRIGLLSNGSESHKGNEVTRETHAQLNKATHLNYTGYVEGYDLFKGTADVIVADGFVGNVVLKSVEGLAKTLGLWFRKEIRFRVFGWIGVALLKRLLRKFKKKFDYQPYGAAPLLGVDGLVWISHGNSTRLAISNGILTAQKAVQEAFNEKFATFMQDHQNNRSLIGSEKNE